MASATELCGNVNTNKYSHPLHANALLKALNEGRKNANMCDGIVVIRNNEIPVQRNVLAAASPYFRGLYHFDSCGEGRQISTCTLDDLTVEIFELILDYIYTSVIMLSEDNIQDILQAADILLMSDLKELGCDFLEECISPSNCLGILEFTERFTCPRVHHKADCFLDEHFCDISYSEEFQQLPLERLVEILRRDSLRVRTEDVIFESILRWVRYDTETRKQELQQLISRCVQLRYLEDRYIQEHVIADELIRSCGLESWLLQAKREDKQYKQRGYSNVIVVAGGEGPCDGSSGTVEIKASVRCVVPHNGQDARYAHWIDLASMSSPRVGHGLVQAGGYLYAIGGRDNSGHILNTGERYDPVLNQWTSIASMSHARVGFGLLSLDDKIYALGGSNDMSDPLTSVEEYNIYTNTWRSIPDMNLKRAWSTYAVANKKLYVMGGGVMGKLYEAVECYDPKTEIWTSVAPMKERRFDARSAGFGDSIWVFGGLRRLECPSVMQHGSGMKFCGTEMYSVSQKQWASMNQASQGMCSMTEMSHIDAVLCQGEELYVVGDLNIAGTFHCIRAFQVPASRYQLDARWRGVIHNHPPNQRGMQACFMKLSNARIYDLLWSQDKLTFTDIHGQNILRT